MEAARQKAVDHYGAFKTWTEYYITDEEVKPTASGETEVL